MVEQTTKSCGVVDWGEVPYAWACAGQAQLVARRQAGEIPDLLILCQHPPVITLGRNARRENVRLAEEELARRGVELHATNRGGDVTFHGPGQLVGYPILDLSFWRKDVVGYVRALEEVLIRAARELGVEAGRRTAPKQKRQLYTGVWVREEKLAAIGVRISRWVTSHGFALNVATDLSYFDLVVPCGIGDKSVTSLERVLLPSGVPRLRSLRRRSGQAGQGSRWPEHGEEDAALMVAAKQAVVESFGAVFARVMQPIEPDTWEAWLGAHEAAAS